MSVQAAVFDGDAAGPGQDDPQQRNRYGLKFRVNDPPLLLAQMQYAWNNRKGDEHLAGALKIGGWRHQGDFADKRFGNDGRSLFDPASSGNPRMLAGDYGAWTVFEQQLYRVSGSDDRGVRNFVRASYTG